MIDELDRARRRDSHDGYAPIIRPALRRYPSRPYLHDVGLGLLLVTLLFATCFGFYELYQAGGIMHAAGFICDPPPGIIPGR